MREEEEAIGYLDRVLEDEDDEEPRTPTTPGLGSGFLATEKVGARGVLSLEGKGVISMGQAEVKGGGLLGDPGPWHEARGERDAGKSLEMRKLVLSDFLASEEIYINQLEALLLVGFGASPFSRLVLQGRGGVAMILLLSLQPMKPLKATATTSQPVLTTQQIETIFYKIQDLYEIHKEFYDSLYPKVQNWDSSVILGHLFQKLASQLGVYKAFVDNYKIALETAEKCSQSNNQFQKISEELKVKGPRDSKESHTSVTMEVTLTHALWIQSLVETEPFVWFREGRGRATTLSWTADGAGSGSQAAKGATMEILLIVRFCCNCTYALLYKPIDRVTRSTLVLHDLLKHTPSDHPDYPLLQDALRISQNFLSSINEDIDPRRTAVTTPKGEPVPEETTAEVTVQVKIEIEESEIALQLPASKQTSSDISIVSSEENKLICLLESVNEKLKYVSAAETNTDTPVEQTVTVEANSVVTEKSKEKLSDPSKENPEKLQNESFLLEVDVEAKESKVQKALLKEDIALQKERKEIDAVVTERNVDPKKDNDFANECQLCQFDTETVTMIEQLTRQLVKDGFLVEMAEGSRKLRHVFLFTDVLLCAKLKKTAVGKHQQYDCKWYVPLAELVFPSLEELDPCPHVHAMPDHDLEDMKMKISSMKSEVQKEKANKGQSRAMERLKKKMFDNEFWLLLNSPSIPFRIHHRNGKVRMGPRGVSLEGAVPPSLTVYREGQGTVYPHHIDATLFPFQSYLFLLSSDYERAEWREAIQKLQKKDLQTFVLSSVELQVLTGSCFKLRTVHNLPVTSNKDDDEPPGMYGFLHVIVHSAKGFKQSANLYCTLEVDSFGYFVSKAKTRVFRDTTEPQWNEEFEIELEGSQCLRILCYEKCYDKTKLNKDDNEIVDRIVGKGQVQCKKCNIVV
ncbi:UNVERIFIED_CONTAM: hypothetical protein K2H54_031586 [Gekko kuhli]